MAAPPSVLPPFQVPCQPGPALLSYPRAVQEVNFVGVLSANLTQLGERRDATLHAGVPYQTCQNGKCPFEMKNAPIEIRR